MISILVDDFNKSSCDNNKGTSKTSTIFKGNYPLLILKLLMDLDYNYKIILLIFFFCRYLK